jgi:hypothetical protein
VVNNDLVNRLRLNQLRIDHGINELCGTAADFIEALAAERDALQAQLAAARTIERNVQMVREHEFKRAQAADQALAAARADADRYRYVLEGVRDAIKTGRNEPLMIWRDQIDIALSDHPATRAAIIKTAGGKNDE